MGNVKGNKDGKGRPKGSENKLTKDARKVFLDTLEGQVSHIEEAFTEVFKEDKTKFLDLFAKYAQYFVPKKTENTDKVEHTLKDFDIKSVLKFDKPKSND